MIKNKYLMNKINSEGVTLIELLVVTMIIGILAVALGFSFEGWIGKYKIESEIKELYSDLMDARTRAMTRNTMNFVVLNANNYSIYEDTNDNTVPDPGAGDSPISEYRDPSSGAVKPKNLRHSLGWTGTIAFDTRGLSSSAAAITIPVILPAGANPDYDCVLVYQSRITMGQMSGGICAVK